MTAAHRAIISGAGSGLPSTAPYASIVYVSEKLKGNSEIESSDLPLDIIVKFYAGGLINIGIDCITRTKKYSKKELLLYIDKLIPDKIS